MSKMAPAAFHLLLTGLFVAGPAGIFVVYLVVDELTLIWVVLGIGPILSAVVIATWWRTPRAWRRPTALPAEDAPLPRSIEDGGYVMALSDPVDSLLREQLKPGRIIFNPPTEMRNGDRARVEVRIIRNEALDDLLVKDLRGDGKPIVESIETAVRMRVSVIATAGLVVRALSDASQLVATDRFARWDYDVDARRSGEQELNLFVTAILTMSESDLTQSMPVLTRTLRVRVNPIYSSRVFVASNWRWLVGTAIATSVAIATWLGQ